MRPGETRLEDYKISQLKQRVDELCEKIKAGGVIVIGFSREKSLFMI